MNKPQEKIADFKERIAAIMKPKQPPEFKILVRKPTDRGYYPPEKEAVK